nr:unnamed protein product [Digitaria exilis]
MPKSSFSKKTQTPSPQDSQLDQLDPPVNYTTENKMASNARNQEKQRGSQDSPARQEDGAPPLIREENQQGSLPKSQETSEQEATCLSPGSTSCKLTNQAPLPSKKEPQASVQIEPCPPTHPLLTGRDPAARTAAAHAAAAGVGAHTSSCQLEAAATPRSTPSPPRAARGEVEVRVEMRPDRLTRFWLDGGGGAGWSKQSGRRKESGQPGTDRAQVVRCGSYERERCGFFGFSLPLVHLR